MNGRTTHRTTQCSQLLSCGRGLVAKARKGDAPRVKINIRTDRLTKVDEKKETKGRRYYQGQLYLRSTICQSHLNHELQSQVHEDWRRQRRKSNVNPPPLNPPNAPKPEGKVVAVAEEAPERIVTPPNQPSSPRVCIGSPRGGPLPPLLCYSYFSEVRTPTDQPTCRFCGALYQI